MNKYNEQVLPRVSIIIPTYNRADFLPESVGSVLAQTFRNFEILIVDDGSTDNTREILKSYLSDVRIKYFYQENQGQSVARNLALKHARGEFICFLDSDNAWFPEKLSEQLSIMDSHPEIDIVYGDAVTIDEFGNEISRQNMKRYSGLIAKYMVKDNIVSMNTTMARYRCFVELGGMSGKRRVADDYDLWLRFSSRFVFHHEPRFWAKYRVMRDQISSDKRRRFLVNEEIITDFRREYPDALSEKEFDDGFAHFYARKARYFAGLGERRHAFRVMLSALKHAPMNLNVWRSMAAVLLKRR